MPPLPNVSAFLVTRSMLSAGPFTPVGDIPNAATLEFTDHLLAPATRYYYKIYAVNISDRNWQATPVFRGETLIELEATPTPTATQPSPTDTPTPSPSPTETQVIDTWPDTGDGQVDPRDLLQVISEGESNPVLLFEISRHWKSSPGSR